MFYPLIKIWVRFALRIFVKDVAITNPRALETTGPVLITANHPNSFLDAIIIGAAYKHPIYFLARGDAFNKPWHAKLLRLLQMIPVYRLSEGKENLALNEEAFRKSKEVLSSNGILLIFIEGICVHKHELQPFKKGAARIVTDCSNIPGMKVLPITIAYNSFESFGKTININCGNTIPVKDLLPFEEETKNMRYMNGVLYTEIESRIQVPKSVPQTMRDRNIAGRLAAMIGTIVHWPLYKMLSNSIAKKTRGTVFYDSVLFGALLIIYPVYLLLLILVLLLFGVPATVIPLIIVLHPITARYAVQYK